MALYLWIIWGHYLVSKERVKIFRSGYGFPPFIRIKLKSLVGIKHIILLLLFIYLFFFDGVRFTGGEIKEYCSSSII